MTALNHHGESVVRHGEGDVLHGESVVRHGHGGLNPPQRVDQPSRPWSATASVTALNLHGEGDLRGVRHSEMVCRGVRHRDRDHRRVRHRDHGGVRDQLVSATASDVPRRDRGVHHGGGGVRHSDGPPRWSHSESMSTLEYGPADDCDGVFY